MKPTEHGSELSERVKEFVLDGFTPDYGGKGGRFPSGVLWRRLRELGSELWLDTGDLDEAGALWTAEFTGLTTNNTLLNREVQKGVYDDLVVQAGRLLDEFPDLSARDRRLELAFILNARHALRLVERFDAFVSVEEHTDLTNDLAGTVNYARRYHEICPERFYVKIPFSPAGVLATRRVSEEGIPVNHTLGFSARQNYVIARLGRPAFVNVFLGRLNSFVADNRLGDGALVGERAALASQRVVAKLRDDHGVPSRQIGASFRQGEQVCDLAGLDVMTIPPKVAREFLELGLTPAALVRRTAARYEPKLASGVDASAVGLPTLWDVDEAVRTAVDAAEKAGPARMTADELVALFAGHGCRDLFVRWTEADVATSAAEGKIPKLEHWRTALAERRCGLDSLMNLAGWNSFRADQAAMDERVAKVLAKKGR